MIKHERWRVATWQDHSQGEGFVVFGRPAVVLGFGGVLALLVAEVRADDEHFHKRTEYPLRLPPQVVGGHHCHDGKKRTGVSPTSTIALLCTASSKHGFLDCIFCMLLGGCFHFWPIRPSPWRPCSLFHGSAVSLWRRKENNQPYLSRWPCARRCWGE